MMAPPASAVKREDMGADTATGGSGGPPLTAATSSDTSSVSAAGAGRPPPAPGGPSVVPSSLIPPGQSLMTAVQWSPIVSDSTKTAATVGSGNARESGLGPGPSQPFLGSAPTDTTNVNMDISIDEAIGLTLDDGGAGTTMGLGLPDPSTMPEPVPVDSMRGQANSAFVGAGRAAASGSQAKRTGGKAAAAAAAKKKTSPAKNSSAMMPPGSARLSSSSSMPQQQTGAPSSLSSTAEGGIETGDRRQRRLERNRESARLSRRRRKQYLEELEERVTFLSEQMDSGRRDHVSEALGTVQGLRRERLREVERDLALDLGTSSSEEELNRGITSDGAAGGEQEKRKVNPITLEHHVRALDTYLSRTSEELRIAATFQKQQLLSLSLPQHRKFVLWLTVQNDSFYRGGRAASERLSATRIGERMLQNGNDRVPPSGDMWPLFCHDVGLSYDQEEKIRAYQRTLLMENEPWLHRHTAAAADATIEATTKAINSAAEMVQRRERSLHDVLTVEQRAKFLAWAAARRDRIERVAKARSVRGGQTAEAAYFGSGLLPLPERCDAANLYIVNDRLNKVCLTMPTTPPLVRPASLKKLARRASFESLRSSMASLEAGDKKGGMSREKSFPSTGSLKRTAASMSEDDLVAKAREGPSPEAAEKAAAAVVESSLNDVRDIIPKSPPRDFVNICPPQPARGKPPSQRQSYGQQQQPQQQQQYMHQGGYARAKRTPSPAHVLPQQMAWRFSPGSPTSPLGLPLSASNTPIPVDVASGEVDVEMQAIPPMPLAMPMQGDQQQQQQVANPLPPVAEQIDPESFVDSNNGTIPSLLPPHMSIVPEDGYLNNVPAVGADDDFLFDLMEGDWAIEGFDMEATK